MTNPVKNLQGKKNHLPESGEERQEACRNQSASELEFADPYIFDASAPWSPKKDVSLVPEVLNGDDAVPARWVFVVGVAIGIAVLLLVLLAVSTAIGQLV